MFWWLLGNFCPQWDVASSAQKSSKSVSFNCGNVLTVWVIPSQESVCYVTKASKLVRDEEMGGKPWWNVLSVASLFFVIGVRLSDFSLLRFRLPAETSFSLCRLRRPTGRAQLKTVKLPKVDVEISTCENSGKKSEVFDVSVGKRQLGIR